MIRVWLFIAVLLHHKMSTSSALTGYVTAHNSQQQQQQQPPPSRDNDDVQKTKCLPCEGLDPSARLSYEQVLERITTLPMWTVIPASTVTTTTKATATAAPSSLGVTAATIDCGDDDDDGTNHQEQPIWMISRKFTARNFQAAMNAVNAMGTIAEREQHHPDFHLTSYRHVQIDIYTHSVQGLTENDFILAHLLDTEVTIDYSPKWLNEQPWGSSSKKTTS
jgi:pterin-4a-carbinolamine dehydratase